MEIHPRQADDNAARRDLAELDRPSAAAGDRNLPPPPGQLYDLAGALGETKNVAAEHPKIIAEMKALLEKFVTDGRTTPGERQKNDVAFRRFEAKLRTPKS